MIKETIIQKASKHEPYSIYGVSYRTLSPRQCKLLRDNSILADNTEQFLKCIFYIEDSLFFIKKTNFLFIDKDNIKSMNWQKKELKFHKWTCAYCKKDITVHESEFSPKTLTCENCYQTYLHNKENWTQMIMNSVNKFTDYLKNKHLSDQIKLEHFIKNKKIKNKK